MFVLLQETRCPTATGWLSAHLSTTKTRGRPTTVRGTTAAGRGGTDTARTSTSTPTATDNSTMRPQCSGTTSVRDEVTWR